MGVGAELKKKAGPLPRWGWGAVGAGAFGVYYILKKRSAAASGVSTTTALEGGSSIPVDTQSATGTTASTGSTTYATYQDWLAAAITAITANGGDPADALNGLSSWVNGTCVSGTQYKAIDSIINTVGLPPGFGSSLPTLSVCASSPAPTSDPTPATPAPAAATTPHPQTATLGGVEYYVLGSADQAGNYTGWNLLGGAPAFFTWTGQGTPVQQKPPPGATGVDVYTPTSTPLDQIADWANSIAEGF